MKKITAKKLRFRSTSIAQLGDASGGAPHLTEATCKPLYTCINCTLPQTKAFPGESLCLCTISCQIVCV